MDSDELKELRSKWPRAVITDEQRRDIAIEVITSYINHNIQNCMNKHNEQALEQLIWFVEGMIRVAGDTECIDFFDCEELTTMLEDKTRKDDEA